MFRQEAMGDPGYNMFTLGVYLHRRPGSSACYGAESVSETSMATEELDTLKNTSLYHNDTLAQLERRKTWLELYSGRESSPQLSNLWSLRSSRLSSEQGGFFNLLDGS